jgi:hypothetical protein
MKISLMALVAGFCLVVGLPLVATAGPTPGGANGDADSVENFFDNCYLDTNPDQKDYDHDGCGNVCDSDSNNDGNVNSSDFTAFKATYLKGEGSPGYNPNYDGNCDGNINSTDFTIFKGNYLSATGPSGFPAAQRTLPACPGPF